jgi:hypothetical protein
MELLYTPMSTVQLRPWKNFPKRCDSGNKNTMLEFSRQIFLFLVDKLLKSCVTLVNLSICDFINRKKHATDSKFDCLKENYFCK